MYWSRLLSLQYVLDTRSREGQAGGTMLVHEGSSRCLPPPGTVKVGMLSDDAGTKHWGWALRGRRRYRP